MSKENCEKCRALNEKYPSNENWNVQCPECAEKDMERLIRSAEEKPH